MSPQPQLHEHHEDEEQQEASSCHGNGDRGFLDLIGLHKQLRDRGE